MTDLSFMTLLLLMLLVMVSGVAVALWLRWCRQRESLQQVLADLHAEIAGRERTAASLQESEERLASIFAVTPDPIILARLSDGRFIDVNDAFCRAMGYAHADLIGKTSQELELWVDWRERAPIVADARQQGILHSIPMRMQSRDKRPILFEASIRVFSLQGEDIILWAMRDVTERARMERDILELNLQLEARVEQRTAELAEANRELAQTVETLQLTQEELVQAEKLAALGRVVAGVAHELNTPIGNSVTVASTLEDKTRSARAEFEAGQLRKSALEAYFALAGESTDLLLRSLAQARQLVMSFKQVAADQSSAARRVFDLRTVIEEVLLTLQPTLRKLPYVVRVDVPAGIDCDSFPGPLGQIVTNMVNNAMLHAFEGRTTGCLVIMAEALDAGRLRLQFEDDGIGILPEQLPRVFDPFYTTKLGCGGSGLGLNIVYNIVTRMLGGRIEVSSVRGQGTVFTVLMPRVAPREPGISDE